MRVWRLCKAKHAATAFSGIGARISGGRWNPKGLAIVYTTDTPALALLEILVHVDADDLPPRLVLIPADIPDDLPRTLWKESSLPREWRRFPHPASTRTRGARWARAARTAVLVVPSAVVPGQNNIVLNPGHPDFRRIRIGRAVPFRLDLRLWRSH
jgi:RES domain-containing protein